MRVIGGTARGRPLRAPPGEATRPTGDRVREALFSVLGGVVAGAAVLDLYAGSGALGIEALSRGAARAVFVERDRRVAGVIRDNLRRAGVEERGRVLAIPVERYCREPVGAPFDIVLADPPYATALSTVYRALARLWHADALAPDAEVVVERHRRDPDLDRAPPPPLAPRRRRPYGDTVLLHLHVAP